MRSGQLKPESGPVSERRGLSIIEVLVAVLILGVVLALLAPAVVQSRESSRGAQCKSHLKEFGIAIDNFQTAKGHYPPWSNGSLSFHVQLLPYIDQKALFDRFDFSGTPAAADRNVSIAVDAAKIRLPLHRCPSDGAAEIPNDEGSYPSSYVGNFGSGVLDRGFDGMFGLRDSRFPGPLFPRKLRPGDVRDGLSNTALLSETLVGDGTWARLRTVWETPQMFGPADLESFAGHCQSLAGSKPPDNGDPWRGHPWTLTFGPNSLFYHHVLPPNSKSCLNGNHVPSGIYSSASLHTGGVNVLYADGRVEFTSENINPQVWRDAGSRR